MSEKLAEKNKAVTVFPGGPYGVLAVGGSTGPWVNGAATPGTTGPLGSTGPLGGPIDTRGFDKLMIVASQKGATGANQAVTLTAKHGPNPWLNDSGTTGVNSFTLTLNPAQGTYQQIGEINCQAYQRYIWIQSAIAGLGESDFSVIGILGNADKLPVGNTVIQDV